jgi:superfamily II DNA/RNA helicase
MPIFEYYLYKLPLNFKDFPFVSALQEGLDAMNFNNPTPIQELAIPIILEGNDLVACAQTGTGKTAAYVLPILDRIARSDHNHLNTLIIAPTRELAQQIDQQIEGFSYFTRACSISIYGGGDGKAWEQQQKALREGADIIIATPGRLLALMAQKDVDFSFLKHLVLDEADRMLDMGFYEDILRIIKELPVKRQTLLFSATMPPRIRKMANQILNHPKEISIAVSKPAEKIRQDFYSIENTQKIPMILDILKNPEFESVIIFASTKENVKKLNIVLQKSGLKTSAFHSDLEQSQREELMRDFKSKRTKVLVGTDVLSRGIDVEGISLVVNFDVPPDPEDYIHRIGRTARAKESGVAITFVNSHDKQRFHRIEKLIGHTIKFIPIPEHIGVSEAISEAPKRKHPQRRPPQKGNGPK